MDSKTKKIISEAKLFLKKNSRDFAHDLVHHKYVSRLAKRIYKKEALKINYNALLISSWWHDVCIGKPKSPSILNVKENVSYLGKRMKELNFDQKMIHIVNDSVLNHEFGSHPKTTEGKILQDADKLEAFNPKRVQRCSTAVKKGKMSRGLLKNYVQTSKLWSKKARDLFHFEYSKNIFDERMKQISKKRMYDEHR